MQKSFDVSDVHSTAQVSNRGKGSDFCGKYGETRDISHFTFPKAKE